MACNRCVDVKMANIPSALIAALVSNDPSGMAL